MPPHILLPDPFSVFLCPLCVLESDFTWRALPGLPCWLVPGGLSQWRKEWKVKVFIPLTPALRACLHFLWWLLPQALALTWLRLHWSVSGAPLGTIAMLSSCYCGHRWLPSLVDSPHPLIGLGSTSSLSKTSVLLGFGVM